MFYNKVYILLSSVIKNKTEKKVNNTTNHTIILSLIRSCWEAAHPELVGTGSVAASSPPPQVAQVAPAKDGGAPPRPDDAVVLQPTTADNRDLVHRLFPKVHVPGTDVPRRVNWTM